MIDGRQDESLYTVDLGTGAASLVGVHGIEDLFGLAYDTTNDTLYGSGETPFGFYVMNQMNGVAGFIGDPGIAADGLTYDSTRDQIVAIEGGPVGTLYTIDRATGAPTVLSSEGNFDNGGLAYDPDLDLYWALDLSGNLYTYDPNAGYTRTLVIAGLPEHCGLTYIEGLSP